MSAADELFARYCTQWDESIDYKSVKPNLILQSNATNFYEMTIDDFIMENYEPMKPQLRLELGI